MGVATVVTECDNGSGDGCDRMCHVVPVVKTNLNNKLQSTAVCVKEVSLDSYFALKCVLS